MEFDIRTKVLLASWLLKCDRLKECSVERLHTRSPSRNTQEHLWRRVQALDVQFSTSLAKASVDLPFAWPEHSSASGFAEQRLPVKTFSRLD